MRDILISVLAALFMVVVLSFLCNWFVATVIYFILHALGFHMGYWNTFLWVWLIVFVGGLITRGR